MAFPVARAEVSEGLLSVAVGPASGVRAVQEVSFYDTLSFTFNLDQGDQLGFTIPAFSPEAVYLDELATDVWLEGVVRQRYRVIGMEQDWDDSGADLIAVTAVSYKRLLNSRNLGTDLSYTQIDQGDIIWNLIAHTQARPGGDWGVTKGVTATGTLRDRQYVLGENIGDLANKITQVIGGCTFNINADKVYSAKMPATFKTWAQPLQLGVTARRLHRNSTGSFHNAALATGGQGTTPVWVEAANITTDPRGRWEHTAGYPNVILQPTLVEHAQGLLSAGMAPKATWKADLEPTHWASEATYMPGEFVVLVVPQTLAAPIGTPAEAVLAQVIEVTASYTADGALGLAAALIEVGPLVLG